MIAFAKPDNQIDALPLGVVVHGDALAVLKTMETSSVDAIVTDPPAGVGFMGKDWDTFNPERLQEHADYRKRTHKLPPGRKSSAFCGPANYAGNYDLSRKGRDAFIKFMTDIMSEALRVLKPGGHALVWSLPRTSHWTALALEDAGFEIRDCVYHIFGSGFPKSTAIDKQIDKRLGAEREVVGATRAGIKRNGRTDAQGGVFVGGLPEELKHIPVTAPATPEAAEWDGWGTALKPAVECWWLCRKPLAEPSIAANVLKYGVGGINVDACRVGNETIKTNAKQKGQSFTSVGSGQGFNGCPETTHQGRWPANLLLSHSLWCTPNGTKRVRGTAPPGRPTRGGAVDNSAKGWGHSTTSTNMGYADPDGMEEVEDWHCAEDCPIRLLDEQSGVTRHVRNGQRKGGIWASAGNGGVISAPGDQGGASRYFTNLPPDVPFLYTSKASRSERNAGCEGLPEQRRSVSTYGSIHIRQCNVCGTHSKEAGPNGRWPNCEHEDWEWVEQHDTGVKGGNATNSHPTVKPLTLMRWLVRLVTPPDGIVLDPFLGSGSTAVAAIQEGYHFIGIEQDESYVRIAEARIAHARREVS